MGLFQKIQDEAKKAMIAKDTLRLNTLKSVKAVFLNELINKPGKNELTDDEAVAVIKRLVKQRKDSIDQFRAGGREDLVKNEEDELKILEVYLPKMMSKEEILKIAEKKKVELGITDKTKSNILMSGLMKDLKGRADGSDVKSVVDQLFS
jgi:uncharacterized protein YqeY